MRSFGSYLTIVDRYGSICLYSGSVSPVCNSSYAAAVYRETSGIITEYRISVIEVCIGVYGTAVYGDVMGTVQSMTKFALGSGCDIAVLDDDIPGTAYSMTVSAVGIGCDIATDRDITAGAQPASPRHFISFKFVSGIRYNGASVNGDILAAVYSMAVLVFGSGCDIAVLYGDSPGTVYSMYRTEGFNAAIVDGEVSCIYTVASGTTCVAVDLSAVNGELIDIYGITHFFIFRPAVRRPAA